MLLLLINVTLKKNVVHEGEIECRPFFKKRSALYGYSLQHDPFHSEQLWPFWVALDRNKELIN